jgi:hypothetical protein
MLPYAFLLVRRQNDRVLLLDTFLLHPFWACITHAVFKHIVIKHQKEDIT